MGQRKPWDSNPQVAVRPTVFKTVSSSGRMASVFASCGSWNRTNIETFRAFHPAIRRSRRSICVSCGGRNRTCGTKINSPRPVPTQDTASISSITMAVYPRRSQRIDDERSGATCSRKRPAGIEPTHPAWQAGRLPLHHGRDTTRTELSKIRRGLFSMAELSVRLFSVGPEGLEPSPAWVRTRDAAVNTSVPNGLPLA